MRLTRHPGLWLAALLIGVFLYWDSVGYLVAHRHADSFSYIRAAGPESLEQALSYHRTAGYPLLVDLLQDGSKRTFELRYRALIVFQAVTYLVATWLLWYAVRCYAGSGWLAFAFAAPLPFAGVVRTVWNVGPDFLAAALVVTATALLLWIADSRPRWWVLAPFAVAVFLCYQMRPAGMFLVGFLPLAGVLLSISAGVTSPRRLARLGTGLAAATLLPFLAFSALRWAVVGHFGVVSFTGSNQAAVAMCFLDTALTRELPPDVQPLARQVLKRRQQRGWRAMGAYDDPELWFEQYSDNVWGIGRASARSAVFRERGADAGEPTPPGERSFWVEQDARLEELARAILIRRPGLYARWFHAAIGYGLTQLRDVTWIVVPCCLLVLSLPFAAWRVELGRRRPVRSHALAQAERRRRLMGLGIVSVTYFAVYLSAVSLVSFPFDRYLTSMTLFLPGLACSLVFEVWRSIAAPEEPATASLAR
jgi:hypothetical protein